MSIGKVGRGPFNLAKKCRLLLVAEYYHARKSSSPEYSAFADQIPTACWPHFRGVNRSRRDVAPASRVKRLGPTVRCQGHLAAQNDVGGFGVVRVPWIKYVRAVLPNIRAAESF